MKIKFHDTLYDLIERPNNYQTRFQCQIEKGDHTYDSIIADTVSPEEITVYDDEDEVVGIYTGFTNRIAITIMDNINLEFENANIEAQLNSFATSVEASISSLESEQTNQAEAIVELEAASDQQNSAIEDLMESQEVQDGAIEDLAEVVSSIIE